VLTLGCWLNWVWGVDLNGRLLAPVQSTRARVARPPRHTAGAVRGWRVKPCHCCLRPVAGRPAGWLAGLRLVRGRASGNTSHVLLWWEEEGHCALRVTVHCKRHTPWPCVVCLLFFSWFDVCCLCCAASLLCYGVEEAAICYHGEDLRTAILCLPARPVICPAFGFVSVWQVLFCSALPFDLLLDAHAS
jgi:hypothetical protein